MLAKHAIFRDGLHYAFIKSAFDPTVFMAGKRGMVFI